MSEPAISNISDTARWVAVYRAWETARPDALFRDPFAERLAGPRGKQIAEAMRRPNGTANGWPMITRTKLIDDLVLQSVADGCDCVLNLAAGLDSRAYRLALPASLRWIEVDLPAITDEKAQLLAGEQPVCRLEREKVDLADTAARQALFERVAKSAERVLVLTEGLLIYLEPEHVRALGRELALHPTFRFWMLDLLGPALLSMIVKGYGDGLANAPMKFGPENGVAFFEALGWKVRDVKPMFRAALEFKRVPFLLRVFGWLPEPDIRRLGRARWSAVVRFERPG